MFDCLVDDAKAFDRLNWIKLMGYYRSMELTGRKEAADSKLNTDLNKSIVKSTMHNIALHGSETWIIEKWTF